MKTTLRRLLIAATLACAGPGLALAKAAAGAAPATVALDACSWDRPGVNPFMGDVVAAVDRYRDIPLEVRVRLKARMAKREYDDLVSIRRDSINGRGGYDYGSAITEMHFGTNQLCRSVTRASWLPSMEERGLVYCESGHCIIVPTVCRNVSRITRKGVGSESAEALPLLPVAPPDAVSLAGDMPAIDWFGPTGAGMPAGAGVPAGAAGAVPAIGGSFAGSAGSAGGSVLGLAAAMPFLSRNESGPSTTTGSVPPAGSVAGIAPLTPVPEPQTWAMLVGGLGAIWMVARRRRADR